MGRPKETQGGDRLRLRKMELEPQHYDVDINKEVSKGGALQGQQRGGLGAGRWGTVEGRGGCNHQAHSSPR